jgi:hypothetical protein
MPKVRNKDALVIVHLSSIESLKQECGSTEARAFGDAIIYEAKSSRSRGEKVYVIDQFWPGALRDKLADELLRNGCEFIRFDENTASWDWFLPRLKGRLERDGIESVRVGGLWFDPDLRSGCATQVYLYLKQFFATKVDEDIVACGCEDDEEDYE